MSKPPYPGIAGKITLKAVARTGWSAIRQSKMHGIVPTFGGGLCLAVGAVTWGAATDIFGYLLSIPLIALGAIGLAYAALAINNK